MIYICIFVCIYRLYLSIAQNPKSHILIIDNIDNKLHMFLLSTTHEESPPHRPPTSATTSPLVASNHINIAIHCRLPAQAARRAQLVPSARWLQVLKTCSARLHWRPFSQALSMVFSRMVFIGNWERHLQNNNYWGTGGKGTPS